MRVTVCNRTFEIRESTATINNVVSIKFHVDIDGEIHTLGAEYTTTTADELAALHNVSVSEVLREILEQEVRVEIFRILKKVSLNDILDGKYPELIPEWVRDFGAEDLSPEVQEKYIDMIAEAMKGKA